MDDSKLNLIEVEGSASQLVEPDKASWNINLKIRGNSAQRAFEACHHKRNALMASLQKVAGADVTTQAISVSAVQERKEVRGIKETRHTYEIVGYDASARIALEVPVAKASEIPQLLVDEHISAYGPSFSVSNQTELEKQIRVEAAKEAQAEAERIAHALGHSLGSVHRVSTKSVQEMDMFAGGAPAMSYRKRSSSSDESQPTVLVEIKPEKVRLSEDISISFHLL